MSQEEPYVMIKKENGNYVYTGFCIDLLEKISKICNFTYKIRLVEDGYHGSWNGSKWNGMIGELVRHEADLAISSLTITLVREQAVEFSLPFMNLGISIMVYKPEEKVEIN